MDTFYIYTGAAFYFLIWGVMAWSIETQQKQTMWRSVVAGALWPVMAIYLIWKRLLPRYRVMKTGDRYTVQRRKRMRWYRVTECRTPEEAIGVAKGERIKEKLLRSRVIWRD